MSTNINDLPISPQTENISMSVNESNIKLDNNINALQEKRNHDISVEQQPQTIENSLNENINEFVSGIQQASASGMLSLPTRDIPQNQNHIIQDEQTKNNYIPNNNSNDYIQPVSSENIIKENSLKENKKQLIDNIYNEIHIPLLISVLYFLFELPIVNKTIFKLLPYLFKKDGNTNLLGYITKSCVFGIIYFIFSYGIKYVSI